MLKNEDALKNEGVAAYFPKETCRDTSLDTSLLSENSRVGGDFPPQKHARPS